MIRFKNKHAVHLRDVTSHSILMKIRMKFENKNTVCISFLKKFTPDTGFWNISYETLSLGFPFIGTT